METTVVRGGGHRDAARRSQHWRQSQSRLDDGHALGRRFAIFTSTATDLVAGITDSNGGADVFLRDGVSDPSGRDLFLRDLDAGTSSLVSVTTPRHRQDALIALKVAVG